MSSKRRMIGRACLLAMLVTAVASGPGARASVPDPAELECGEGTFKAEFFDNVDLTGRAFLVECHERIDFDWGHGRAHPRVPEDHFGVRWSADITFVEGTYRFAARTDDGTRLYLNGETIIDAWSPRPVGTTVAFGHVPAGTHSLVVEYFEQAGHAVAQVEWTRSTTGWFQVPEAEWTE
jgi:hypothetical protein